MFLFHENNTHIHTKGVISYLWKKDGLLNQWWFKIRLLLHSLQLNNFQMGSRFKCDQAGFTWTHSSISASLTVGHSVIKGLLTCYIRKYRALTMKYSCSSLTEPNSSLFLDLPEKCRRWWYMVSNTTQTQSVKGKSKKS